MKKAAVSFETAAFRIWWRIRDSNPGPADYDSVAMPRIESALSGKSMGYGIFVSIASALASNAVDTWLSRDAKAGRRLPA
ncbi:hypothetical protein [Burkholderia cenocepacia]|uniref:hypothetical protein n=1 Tax=Burkholderia cenocepacia TaxID=95486 RepID=UPI0024B70B51|nr:hypothetical protein [Burkholderia cenocepacia]MDI9676890.1 hypothetical protein [Burkholderia cenocepacia]